MIFERKKNVFCLHLKLVFQSGGIRVVYMHTMTMAKAVLFCYLVADCLFVLLITKALYRSFQTEFCLLYLHVVSSVWNKEWNLNFTYYKEHDRNTSLYTMILCTCQCDALAGG